MVGFSTSSRPLVQCRTTEEAYPVQVFLYVLLGVVFLLGLLFIQAYRRKDSPATPQTSER